ncbi:P-II family nitrogen regulator [Desulfonatronovibrio hydrogenovorans]|uniref:P-II family nitrogen regulator n=1 Tax=Desulfonatronovibrio hydrogenovorans TaxID=53245 RepID=UPI00048F571D|nr:P-II family nitrogen regulator [Desulfonatronovibrio hydrogenovorans]
MKEVLAIVRANKINQTKEALVAAGLPSFTGSRCVGRGRRPVDFETLEALNRDPSMGTDVLPGLAQGARLIPKRMLSMVVPKERVKEIVEVIIKTNQTGTPGDGKVFVLPVSDVFRVRTREEGLDAIDEMKG